LRGILSPGRGISKEQIWHHDKDCFKLWINDDLCAFCAAFFGRILPEFLIPGSSDPCLLIGQGRVRTILQMQFTFKRRKRL
jgi:hypothetical protein